MEISNSFKLELGQLPFIHRPLLYNHLFILKLLKLPKLMFSNSINTSIRIKNALKIFYIEVSYQRKLLILVDLRHGRDLEITLSRC